MPYQRDADQIVADWRQASADLEIVPLDSSEAGNLRAEIERLRVEYMTLAGEAIDHDREITPFPDSDEPD